MVHFSGNIEAAEAGTARSMTGGAALRDFEAPTARAVRHELFTEALLAAGHARLEELKTASMNFAVHKKAT